MLPGIEKKINAAGLTSGNRVLVAVSGGVDSVVLLHLLADSAARFGLQVQVAHLDHQIRSNSHYDADFVRQLSDSLQLPCVVGVVDVPALKRGAGISLEMAGRQARRDFLLRTADQVDARMIALAHHRDDQVETFLLRLLRGSGATGLAAMRTLHGRWWRPLLDCSREQIQTYAKTRNLSWVEDASNVDPQFLRNRVRHNLVPQLGEINPQFSGRVSELCRQLQVDEDYWCQQVEAVFPSLIESAQDGLRLKRQELLGLHEALRVRVLREALRQLRGDLQRLEAIHLNAIVELVTGKRSQAQLDLPGCWVARRYETLWLRKCAPESVSSYDMELPVPGELRLPCGRVLRVHLTDEPAGEFALAVEFSLAEIGAQLRVRSWQPGDRFEPLGLQGSKKLKLFFGDAKVELEDRLRVPLLISGKQILWLAGMRRSRHATVNERTKEILRVELLEEA
ncbi:tRNA lysidine(34) synthetase TilS [Malonomonas rubra]|uniref:tRNA lysidine(34) synthetase TilS n=1 Tax=Malonomonas rubra TaxID=57040 RepID=UPI0026EE59DB|nr:tRNA lysidine(34) synthetase TilS [Malonomonas rubra]